MFILRKKFRFESAHRLPGHKHCGVLHGHSYFGEVEIWSRDLDENGFVMDFGEIKEIINEYDHSGEVIEKSSELLAKEIGEKILKKIKVRPVKVIVRLNETATGQTEWRSK